MFNIFKVTVSTQFFLSIYEFSMLIQATSFVDALGDALSVATGTSQGLRCSTSGDAVKVTGWEAPLTTILDTLW